MNETGKFTVTFLPSGKNVVCTGGEGLLEIARQHGVRIAADCGGGGHCHSCVVRIEGTMPQDASASSGLSSSGLSDEMVAAGWRLACQFRLAGSCTIHVPPHNTAGLVPLGQDDGPAVAPIEMPVLAPGPREGFWSRGEHLVGPVAGARAFGLAVDLGTTNIAAALVEMSSGMVVATGASMENPQTAFGADVISRLTLAVHNPAAARNMQRAAVQAISDLAGRLTGGRLESVAEVAVVGNSVMQHLLLRLPLDSLASAPYRPYTLDDTDILCEDLGLKLAPGAWLYCGPNVAAFVGSDHVAALLEIMVDPPPGRWMLMDIGTNTEISVFDSGELRSTSCASGPAFEGGMLSCGMRAAPGAITRAQIENGKLSLETVGQTEVTGICGSGVVSLLSELVRSGAINDRGRLSSAFPGVREQAHQREFLLANHKENGALPVVFTQTDIRAVQLAKAAIRTGLELLLAATGVGEGAVDRLIVAGAFGKFLDLNAALAIGLIPPAFAGRIVQVGNAAGGGVRRMLVCAHARARARALAHQAKYLELATQPGFQATFARKAAF